MNVYDKGRKVASGDRGTGQAACGPRHGSIQGESAQHPAQLLMTNQLLTGLITSPDSILHPHTRVCETYKRFTKQPTPHQLWCSVAVATSDVRPHSFDQHGGGKSIPVAFSRWDYESNPNQLDFVWWCSQLSCFKTFWFELNLFQGE